LRPSCAYRLTGLPAGFAARTAATTAAARPATAATASATRTSTTTTAAESASTSASTAESAVGFGTGFIDIQRASVQGVTVEGGNGLVRLAFIFHLDECETAGTSGFTIRHDSGTVDLAISFEEAANGLFGSIEIQVAYEYVLHS
jgi:hypothetical protein